MKAEITRYDNGFTLIELLAAMAIMVIIMSISIVSYFGFGQGARLRGSINSLRGKLSLARQSAILNATDTEVRFATPIDGQHYYYVRDVKNNYTIGETNYLPLGIEFGEFRDGFDAGQKIPFKPTGSSGTATTYVFTIDENGGEGAGGSTTEVSVYGITGLVNVE